MGLGPFASFAFASLYGQAAAPAVDNVQFRPRQRGRQGWFGEPDFEYVW